MAGLRRILTGEAMATDDRQIFVAGTAGAPAQWRVPGNGQIRPKAVYATFDGTGAAVAFLPILEVFSDGGELIGRYKANSTVAAGGSADVSWFPHVAEPAAPTPGGAALPWMFYEDFSNRTIPSGGGLVTISMDPTSGTFDTSDATIFGLTLSGGNYLLNLKADGIYWVSAWVQLDFAGAAVAGTGGTLQMTGANHVVGGARDNAWIADPNAGGRSKCTPSFEGIWNLDPLSTPPPITSALQCAQNGGAITTNIIVALLAVQLNPTGSPNF